MFKILFFLFSFLIVYAKSSTFSVDYPGHQYLKDGKPFIIVGTPGGTTIPTSVYQTLINIIDFGLSTEDAVYKPKFHHQWLPDKIFVEKNFPQQTIDSLKKMGYTIIEREAIGRTEVIKVLPDGKFEVVADNRGNDDAEGW